MVKIIEQVAREMAVMLYSDSRIPTKDSIPIIKKGLIADLGIAGNSLPDLYEQECLVYGGPLDFVEFDEAHPDTEGEGNPEVEARFPNTYKAIGSFF